MENIIEIVSKKMSKPEWWVKAIAIEYTECREYTVSDDGLWKYDFEKVVEAELIEAVSNNKVIISTDVLIHNLNESVFRARTLGGLFGNEPLPLQLEPEDSVVEGLASKNWFLFQNDSYIDSKESLFYCFDSLFFLQVYDDEKIYQWNLFQLLSEKDNINNELISEINKIIGLKEENDEKKEALYHKWEQEGETTLLVGMIKDYFLWIESFRVPFLKMLYQLHKEKINGRTFGKVTNENPPVLSRFETFTVNEGKFYTKSYAGPIFFKSCVKHVKAANDLMSKIKHEMQLVLKLDEIYQERASAVIMGASCLESFINEVGFIHFSDLWETIEKLSLEAKIQLFLKLKVGDNSYNKGIEPYKTLGKLITSRNYLVHNKPRFEPVKRDNKSSISLMNHFLHENFIKDLDKNVKLLIEDVCERANIHRPAWLDKSSVQIAD